MQVKTARTCIASANCALCCNMCKFAATFATSCESFCSCLGCIADCFCILSSRDFVSSTRAPQSESAQSCSQHKDEGLRSEVATLHCRVESCPVSAARALPNADIVSCGVQVCSSDLLCSHKMSLCSPLRCPDWRW